VTRFTEGFNRFVTSTIAPVASGWSGCRVELAPTGKSAAFARRTPKQDSRQARLNRRQFGAPEFCRHSRGHWPFQIYLRRLKRTV
jgi:hypothetical protein